MEAAGIAETFESQKLKKSVEIQKYKDICGNYEKSIPRSWLETKIGQPKTGQHGADVEPKQVKGKVDEEALVSSVLPEEYHPPPDSWAGLAKLTGTRPTVDNFTIARYSPAEWQQNHKSLLCESAGQIREAKNIDFKTKCLEAQLCTHTDRQQLQNNVLLRDRAVMIFHWKTELNFVNKEVEVEMEKIQDEIVRLSKCSHAVQLIRNMDGDIQKIRSMRTRSELVHDAVAEEIVKEESLCKEILDLYSRCIDETKMQLTELKDAKGRLQHDWSDKTHAYEVDTACIGLKNNSDTLQWKPGCVQLPPNQSTPESYDCFIKESLIFAKTALTRSEVLRANMKETTSKSIRDLKQQAAAVDLALSEQISKHVEACRSLEKMLKECLKRLSDNELLINKTSEAVRRLDGPMKCAQTRLVMRLTRENVENCRDASQLGLVDEVKTISDSVSALTSQVRSAENSMDSLIKMRQKIEADIIAKKRTLWVDKERCRLMRSFYPSANALSGY